MFSLRELNYVMKNVLKEVVFEENSSSSYFEILMAKDEPSIHDHVFYYLYKLKNVENTHGGVFPLVKSQALACSFIKNDTSPWVFFRFLNWANSTKSRKASQSKFSRKLVKFQSNKTVYFLLN